MKMKIFKLLTVFTIIILISGCDVLGWKKYASEEGNFSVQLPAEPKGQRIILNTDFGRNYLNMYVLNRKDDNFVYSVAFVDYPPELFQSKSADKILEDAKNGAVNNIQGILVKESKISIGKNPGRDITIETTAGNAVVRARFYLVGQRVYQLMVTTDKKWAKSYNINKFLDSLELIK